MTATPGFTGLAGDRTPLYPGPLFAVFQKTLPGPSSVVIKAPYRYSGDAYLYAYAYVPAATVDSPLLEAKLFAVDYDPHWEIDLWRVLPPYQSPRTIIVPPVALGLQLSNGDVTSHFITYSLVPRYRGLTVPDPEGG